MVLRSMIRIALMNRHYKDCFAEFASRAVHTAVALRLGRNRNTGAKHPVLLWCLPAYILFLIVVYCVGAMSAFGLLYWGTRAVNTWRRAFISSGSALSTLGFTTSTSIAGQWLSIPEGALGLGIVVFLFTFIPSYQAVIRSREDKTAWLYVRIGDPPTGVTLLEWCQRTGMAGNMSHLWEAWETWFRMLADTHSIVPMLAVSPSVQSGQSWVLAAAAVLGAAALAAFSVETGDVEAAKILRMGTRAFLAMADALGRASRTTEQGNARLSREKYEAARARLRSAGVPLKSEAGQETQWREFLALRGPYEEALFFVARQTFAPLDAVLIDMAER